MTEKTWHFYLCWSCMNSCFLHVYIKSSGAKMSKKGQGKSWHWKNLHLIFDFNTIYEKKFIEILDVVNLISYFKTYVGKRTKKACLSDYDVNRVYYLKIWYFFVNFKWLLIFTNYHPNTYGLVIITLTACIIQKLILFFNLKWLLLFLLNFHPNNII